MGVVMIIEGKVWKLGNNIDTDTILPGKYLSVSDPSSLGEHCLEGLEKGWAKRISPGDILVAGKNFGCGSSREHAPVALKAVGISCIIAESVGAIFYRNSINIGLPVIEFEDARARFEEGNIISVEIDSGRIENISTKSTYNFSPIAPIVLEILGSGGLLKYITKRS